MTIGEFPEISFIDRHPFGDPGSFANLIRKDNLQMALEKAVREKDTEERKRLAEQLEGLTTGTSRFRSISEIARQPSEQFLLSIDTGFHDLDEYAHFSPGDLVVVAGSTGVGKTILGLNMLCNMTWECPVGLITLEMEGRRIFRGMDKFLSKERIQELSELFFVAEPPPVLPEILSDVNEMVNKARIKCVMIDYLQLITNCAREARNRNQEISHVVREIKNFAKRTGIVVILIFQLSRMIDHRDKKNQKPVLADLKESGDIEYAADIVLLLHRQFPMESSDSVEAELIIAKNRDGKRAVVDLISVR